MAEESRKKVHSTESPVKRPASFRQAFAIVGDIRANANALRKSKFPDQTPEPLIFIFAQCKRLTEVLKGLEKPPAASTAPAAPAGSKDDKAGATKEG